MGWLESHHLVIVKTCLILLDLWWSFFRKNSHLILLETIVNLRIKILLRVYIPVQICNFRSMLDCLGCCENSIPLIRHNAIILLPNVFLIYFTILSNSHWLFSSCCIITSFPCKLWIAVKWTGHHLWVSIMLFELVKLASDSMYWIEVLASQVLVATSWPYAIKL